MPQIPAVCEKCAVLFPSPIDLREGITSTLLSIVVQCPRCGGDGKILDGVYKALQNSVALLRNIPPATDIRQLLAVVESVKRQCLPPEEVTQKISQTAPELSTIADCLPKTRVELYACLTFLVIFLSSVLSAGKNSFTEAELRRFGDVAVQKCYDSEALNATTRPAEEPTSQPSAPASDDSRGSTSDEPSP